jgi:hypothetical protein
MHFDDFHPLHQNNSFKGDSLIIIIGRGHSGTSLISRTLSAGNVWMGFPLNGNGDLVPAESIYQCCKLFAKGVKWLGGTNWDFSRALSGEIPEEAFVLIHHYLKSVLPHSSITKGWKLPETTLIFPWILRLFPEARYIHWVRNPLDNILGGHLTDNLNSFGIETPRTDQIHHRRAISWQYQFAIVKETPKPKRWTTIRFEDFVQKQEETIARLEQFLEIPLARLPVHIGAVDRWKREAHIVMYGFLEKGMREYDYPFDGLTKQ